MSNRLEKALTVEDIRKIAKRRVPRMFYDYCDSGSWTEQTKRRNSEDYAKISLKQRVARDLSNRSTSVQMLGQDVGMPLALAPVGMTGMYHPDGEIHAQKAAEAYGIPFTLGTLSITPIEAVADAASKPFWFQLYVMRDQDFVSKLIKRAIAAECSALIITLDLQITGQRHADLRNGLSAPPKPTLSAAWQIGSKPGWCLRMLKAKSWNFGNVVGHLNNVNDFGSVAEWAGSQLEPKLDWDMIAKLRDQWPGKLILKGVMEPEDAEKCVELGADALIVSNHGGRQLDGAASSISKLPKIVAEFGDKIEVYVDGGIRSGQDILKARALGAKGTLVGRPYIFGLSAGGEKGVARVLEILQTELSITMALCGLRQIQDDVSHIIDKEYGCWS